MKVTFDLIIPEMAIKTVIGERITSGKSSGAFSCESVEVTISDSIRKRLAEIFIRDTCEGGIRIIDGMRIKEKAVLLKVEL